MAQMVGRIIDHERLRLIVIDRHANRCVVVFIDNAPQTFKPLGGEILAFARLVRGRNPTDEHRRNRRFKHRRDEHRQRPTTIQNILASHRFAAAAVAAHFLYRHHVAQMHPKPLAQEIDLRKQVAEGHFFVAQGFRTAQNQRFVHQSVGRHVLGQVQDFRHAVEQIGRREV